MIKVSIGNRRSTRSIKIPANLRTRDEKVPLCSQIRSHQRLLSRGKTFIRSRLFARQPYNGGIIRQRKRPIDYLIVIHGVESLTIDVLPGDFCKDVVIGIWIFSGLKLPTVISVNDEQR